MENFRNLPSEDDEEEDSVIIICKVLEIQHRRRFVYAILTDYYNIQFFKVKRQKENNLHFIYTYTTSESLYFEIEEPPLWQRLVSFLCQIPSELGWLESELKIDDVRIRLERYLGVRRTGVVYEGLYDDEPVAVKIVMQICFESYKKQQPLRYQTQFDLISFVRTFYMKLHRNDGIAKLDFGQEENNHRRKHM
ncbi:3470_t:CDS:2 [Funneliformis mosseae]|uniref:3470_t:CDS:1 n=1 Tax=Funneliformis mosseae TaxID=27381 RepID=A0A9N9GLE0_FUNMO|nr:3470_t:CDS:2 [Funneliformis mosseae]